jgi:hypothetical protein
MNVRTDIFHTLLFDHKKLHDEHKAVLAEKNSLDEKLQLEKAEVARLVKELKRITELRTSETEQLQAEKASVVETEKKLREDAAKEHENALQLAEARATSATEAYEALQASVNQLLPTLERINQEMDGKLLAPLILALSSTVLALCRTVSFIINRLSFCRALHLHPNLGPQYHCSAQEEA